MFPQKQFDINVMYECLKDLDDDIFKKAFNKMLQETEKIDASTNLIAVIREKSGSYRKVRDTTPEWMKDLMDTKKLIVKG